MTSKTLIEILEVKEKQAFAMISVYKDKIDIDELQLMIDNYCKNMIVNFFENKKDLLANKNIRNDLRKHIHSIGADKKHSGKRLFEQLYLYLNTYEKELEK